jgi:hypothetical protein
MSWSVLVKDKELLLFPLLSAIGVILMLVLLLPAGFFVPLSPLLFILFYFGASFITIFHNAAIVACVRKRMHGGDPTIGYGYREAVKHVGAIVVWSAISATVGFLLRQLERWSEDNSFAQLIVSVLGMGWSLVTFFVIPFIVIEGVSATGAIKRSGALFKKTWGEQVVATMSISLGFIMLWILGFVVGIIAFFTTSEAVFVATLIALLVYFSLLAIVQSALSAVFIGVLYSYATGDNIPREFKEVLGNLFTPKTPRRA